MHLFAASQSNSNLLTTENTRPKFGLGEDDGKSYKGVRVEVDFSLIDPAAADEPKKTAVFPNPYRYKAVPEPEKAYFKLDDSTSINRSQDEEEEEEESKSFKSYMEMFEDWNDSRRDTLEELVKEVQAEREKLNKPEENSNPEFKQPKPLGPPPQLQRARGQVWRKFEAGPYLI